MDKKYEEEWTAFDTILAVFVIWLVLSGAFANIYFGVKLFKHFFPGYK